MYHQANHDDGFESQNQSFLKKKKTINFSNKFNNKIKPAYPCECGTCVEPSCGRVNVSLIKLKLSDGGGGCSDGIERLT